MGFLRVLSSLLGGSREKGPQAPGVGPSRGRKAERLKERLPALKHASPVCPRPRRADEKPYAMARYGGDAYLDARVGGSPSKIERFGLPRLETPEELAAWLRLPLKRLAFLADCYGTIARADAPVHVPIGDDPKVGLGRGYRVENRKGPPSKLHHYHYVWVRKRNGRDWRLLEAPKPLLKLAQTRILREILDRVPAHPAAHGFVKGRSIRTNAAEHSNRYVVVKADLADFYPSVSLPRVVAVFRGIGYNLEMARWLARLCTNQVPWGLKGPEGEGPFFMRAWSVRGRHLPQGAPTSPALANLAAWSLDVRLSGLARKAGIPYTRYADDLTFSGSEDLLRKRRTARLVLAVRQIVHAEGFRLNTQKLRILRRGGSQKVTGLTVNVKPNVPRKDFDLLKAILTNCARHGPASQNREGVRDFRAHLLGRIGFVRSVNPQKAERLQRVFDKIKW